MREQIFHKTHGSRSDTTIPDHPKSPSHFPKRGRGGGGAPGGPWVGGRPTLAPLSATKHDQIRDSLFGLTRELLAETRDPRGAAVSITIWSDIVSYT